MVLDLTAPSIENLTVTTPSGGTTVNLSHRDAAALSAEASARLERAWAALGEGSGADGVAADTTV